MACWEWEGYRMPRGYGKAGRIYVHRLVYEHVYGPIPPGMHVCHTCDNPPCIKPAHLWLGTTQMNTADATAKGRMHLGSRNGSAKLTEQMVAEMRGRYAQRTVTQEALAAEYGVGLGTVNRILRGELWPHVVGPRAPQQKFRRSEAERKERRAAADHARWLRNKAKRA